MYHQSSKRNGFTLIELMLAMSFVSILLIAIAFLTIQMSRIYTTGVTMKQVNEAGAELSNALQRSIQSTNSDDGFDYIFFNEVEPNKSGGRICFGSYSYAWNSSEDINTIASVSQLPNHYADSGNISKDTLVRFVRIRDADSQMCKEVSAGVYAPIPADINKVTDILGGGDRNLVVHKLTIDDGQVGTPLRVITVKIGTNDSVALRDGECLPPASSDGNDEYCAVNSFEIVARFGAKGVGE